MKILHKMIALLLVMATLTGLLGIGALAGEEAPSVAATEPATAEDAVVTSPEPEETPASEATPVPEVTEQPLPTVTPEQADPEEPGTESVVEPTAEPEEEEIPAEEPKPAEDPEPTVEPEETAQPMEEAPEDEPAEEAQSGIYYAQPGNDVVEILGGGTMLTYGSKLYYTDGSIWLEENGSTDHITSDEGKNLNLVDGWLYYTVSGSIRRVPSGGGSAETVYTADSAIVNLYVMGDVLRFLSGGTVYTCDMTDGSVSSVSAPAGTHAFIPTPYGDLYLTGDIRDYTLCTEEYTLLSGLQQCYTVGEWLVAVNSEGTWQVPVASLFEGVCQLQSFELYAEEQQALLNDGLTTEEQLEREAAFMESAEYEAMIGGLEVLSSTDGLYYVSSNSKIYSLATNLTTNQTNIVLRARQMAEVEWTPIKWRWSWGGDDSSYVNSHSTGSRCVATDGSVTDGWFAAGKTYKGVPYAQAVGTGYVGWDISLSNFIKAVNNSSSAFYSGYSTYSRTAPYYGSDCSGFVSWAWDLAGRRTCTSLLEDSKHIGKSISSLQVGDCLNNPNSHVILVTNLGYDSSGNIISVEITEQTPAKMRVTCYGEQIPGKYYDYVYSLSWLQSNYLNNGYSIYRRDVSSKVDFTPSDAVDLDKGGYAAAPKLTLSVNETGSAMMVTLSHTNSDAVIYYTLDGSEPTSSSTRYTAPFELSKDTTIRAIADCGSAHTGSHILTYSLSVTKADAPFPALVEGDLGDRGTTYYVSSGTKITLINEDMDTVYYTTDGTTPNKNSAKMPMEGIEVTSAMTIKAVAVSTSDLNSDVVTIPIEIGRFHTISATATSGGVVSPSGDTGVLDGAEFTFVFKADEYYDVEDVLVDGKSVGTPDSYTFADVSGDHTIHVKFSVDLPFTDVNEEWLKDSVYFVYSQGLFNGTSATEFSPNQNMTRGMFITVLGRFARAGTALENWSGDLGITTGNSIYIRASTSTSETSRILATTGLTGEYLQVLGKVSASNSLDGAVWYNVKYKGTTGYLRSQTTGSEAKTLIHVYSGAFTDLPDGAYFTGYAQWGSIKGVVKGISSTSFGPYYDITREDLCVLLYRYLTEYRSYDLSSTTTAFPDDEWISEYAKPAVYAMKKIGVVNGYENGYFYPQSYATRAEVATMFKNLYEWMNSN